MPDDFKNPYAAPAWAVLILGVVAANVIDWPLHTGWGLLSLLPFPVALARAGLWELRWGRYRKGR